MNNDSFNSNGNSAQQFVISYELLCLLRWLLEHDIEKIKKLVSKALATGLREDIKQFEQLGDVNADPAMIEEIQHSIIEFFSMLEMLLLESMKEQAVQRAVEKNLMSAIDHIDSTICDDETVRSSIEKATAKSELHPKENAQDLLFKELLKRWKPSKNMMN
jgi:uncharacterized membrane-anchored protein YjiN (DUF445 family)